MHGWEMLSLRMDVFIVALAHVSSSCVYVLSVR